MEPAAVQVQTAVDWREMVDLRLALIVDTETGEQCAHVGGVNAVARRREVQALVAPACLGSPARELRVRGARRLGIGAKQPALVSNFDHEPSFTEPGTTSQFS